MATVKNEMTEIDQALTIEIDQVFKEHRDCKGIILVDIGGGILTEMLTTGSLFESIPIKCVEGLPEDAKLVSANVTYRGDLQLLFTSDSVEGVQDCTPMMSSEK